MRKLLLVLFLVVCCLLGKGLFAGDVPFISVDAFLSGLMYDGPAWVNLSPFSFQKEIVCPAFFGKKIAVRWIEKDLLLKEWVKEEWERLFGEEEGIQDGWIRAWISPRYDRKEGVYLEVQIEAAKDDPKIIVLRHNIERKLNHSQEFADLRVDIWSFWIGRVLRKSLGKVGKDVFVEDSMWDKNVSLKLTRYYKGLLSSGIVGGIVVGNVPIKELLDGKIFPVLGRKKFFHSNGRMQGEKGENGLLAIWRTVIRENFKENGLEGQPKEVAKSLLQLLFLFIQTADCMGEQDIRNVSQGIREIIDEYRKEFGEEFLLSGMWEVMHSQEDLLRLCVSFIGLPVFEKWFDRKQKDRLWDYISVFTDALEYGFGSAFQEEFLSEVRKVYKIAAYRIIDKKILNRIRTLCVYFYHLWVKFSLGGESLDPYILGVGYAVDIPPVVQYKPSFVWGLAAASYWDEKGNSDIGFLLVGPLLKYSKEALLGFCVGVMEISNYGKGAVKSLDRASKQVGFKDWKEMTNVAISVLNDGWFVSHSENNRYCAMVCRWLARIMEFMEKDEALDLMMELWKTQRLKVLSEVVFYLSETSLSSRDFGFSGHLILKSTGRRILGVAERGRYRLRLEKLVAVWENETLPLEFRLFVFESWFARQKIFRDVYLIERNSRLGVAIYLFAKSVYDDLSKESDDFLKRWIKQDICRTEIVFSLLGVSVYFLGNNDDWRKDVMRFCARCCSLVPDSLTLEVRRRIMGNIFQRKLLGERAKIIYTDFSDIELKEITSSIEQAIRRLFKAVVTMKNSLPEGGREADKENRFLHTLQQDILLLLTLFAYKKGMLTSLDRLLVFAIVARKKAYPFGFGGLSDYSFNFDAGVGSYWQVMRVSLHELGHGVVYAALGNTTGFESWGMMTLVEVLAEIFCLWGEVSLGYSSLGQGINRLQKEDVLALQIGEIHSVQYFAEKMRERAQAICSSLDEIEEIWEELLRRTRKYQENVKRYGREDVRGLVRVFEDLFGVEVKLYNYQGDRIFWNNLPMVEGRKSSLSQEKILEQKIKSWAWRGEKLQKIWFDERVYFLGWRDGKLDLFFKDEERDVIYSFLGRKGKIFTKVVRREDGFIWLSVSEVDSIFWEVDDSSVLDSLFVGVEENDKIMSVLNLGGKAAILLRGNNRGDSKETGVVVEKTEEFLMDVNIYSITQDPRVVLLTCGFLGMDKLAVDFFDKVKTLSRTFGYMSDVLDSVKDVAMRLKGRFASKGKIDGQGGIISSDW